MQHFWNIHALRGVAAMMVVFHHALGQLGPLATPVEFGARGVDLFFVISGFLICLSATKARNATEFALLRLARVVPLYWAACLALVALHLLAPNAFKSTIITGETLVKSLLFIPHYSLAHPGQIWPILVPGWSLSYEMFFYALAAVTLAVSPGSRLMPVVGVLVILVALGFTLDTKSPVLLSYTDPVLLEFCCGVLLAGTVAAGTLPRARLLYLALPLGALLVLGAGSFLPAGVGPLSLVIIGAPLVIVGALAMEQDGLVTKGRILQVLGDASYSIYLSHVFTLGAARILWPPIAKFTGLAGTSFNVPVFVFFASCACAVAGVLIYLFVERPLLDLCKRLVRRSPARASGRQQQADGMKPKTERPTIA